MPHWRSTGFCLVSDKWNERKSLFRLWRCRSSAEPERERKKLFLKSSFHHHRYWWQTMSIRPLVRAQLRRRRRRRTRTKEEAFSILSQYNVSTQQLRRGGGSGLKRRSSRTLFSSPLPFLCLPGDELYLNVDGWTHRPRIPNMAICTLPTFPLRFLLPIIIMALFHDNVLELKERSLLLGQCITLSGSTHLLLFHPNGRWHKLSGNSVRRHHQWCNSLSIDTTTYSNLLYDVCKRSRFVSYAPTLHNELR